ncbi:hypothetical protein T4B_13810 [Trichinella pseudospiralis]|uniref:Uncharacterized protein n=2 Tax=Trichinella pseudospiralis TaxID=6337 RepID=A0A0V1JAG2_TRIPS|nr:hypothetical protein T4D_8980 [Trichinella pseudospiralis]KRZ31945.1 hypothetical protein T4B_13810 [Trichinella pseudospiralis]
MTYVAAWYNAKVTGRFRNTVTLPSCRNSFLCETLKYDLREVLLITNTKNYCYRQNRPVRT